MSISFTLGRTAKEGKKWYKIPDNFALCDTHPEREREGGDFMELVSLNEAILLLLLLLGCPFPSLHRSSGADRAEEIILGTMFS